MFDPVTGKLIVDALKTPAAEMITKAGIEGIQTLLAPVGATLSGGAKLIAARFERLADEERANLRPTLKIALDRIEESGLPINPDPNPKVVTLALEGAAIETRDDLRELWANLLTREFTAGGVHPMIPGILSELTSNDAKMLVRIGDESKTPRRPGRDLVLDGGLLDGGLIESQNENPSADADSRSEAALTVQGLIEWAHESYDITTVGFDLLIAVGWQPPAHSKGPDAA